MENKSHAMIAGLFTIAMLAAVILGAIWLNRDREVRVPYQIATRLFLSRKTVEYHLHKAFTKLGVGGRAELTRLAQN